MSPIPLFGAPSELIAQVLGDWLTLGQVSKLEVALCSAENRVNMGPIYEALIVKNYSMEIQAMEDQIDWLLIRKIRLSSFQIGAPLARNFYSKVVALLKHSKDHLRSFDVDDNSLLLDAIVPTVSQYCTHIDTVRVGQFKLSAPFFAMLGNLRCLKEIAFTYCEDPDVESLSGICFSNVTSLTLVGNILIDVQKAVLRMCPTLLTYSISWARKVDLNELPHSVQSVSAHGCELMRMTSVKGNVEKLNLRDCFIHESVLASVVACCPHVRDLHLERIGFHTESSVMFMLGEAYGERLQRLSIFHCKSVPGGGEICLFEKCTALTYLNLGKSSNTDGMYLATVLYHNPTLQTLDLSHSKMTDDTLMLLVAAASELETLIMCDSSGYTEEGLLALIQGCASLKLLVVEEKIISLLWGHSWNEMRPDLQVRAFV